jgi:hypothetical protein
MTNHRPPGNTEPGENRRCTTLHDDDAMTNNHKEVTPTRAVPTVEAVPTVDTTVLRARYRALGLDAGRASPGAAVLALQVPGLCEADVLIHLGDTQHAAGDLTDARAAWQHALDIFTDLDHPDTNTVRAKLHALDQTPGSTEEPGPGEDHHGSRTP